MRGEPARIRLWLRGTAVAIVVLVILEGVLRVAGLGASPSRPPRFVNPEGGMAAAGIDYLPDPELFWRLRPNASVVLGWYTTNSRGFRGRALPPTRTPGHARVVLLGDSVTFGLGLDLEDSWGHILGRLLSVRLRRPVEIALLAVPGYSSLQIARLARRELPSLNPDLVVVLAGVWNDQAPACGADDEALARGLRPGGVRTLAIYGVLRRLLVPARATRCPPMPTAPPAPGAPLPKLRVDVAAFRENVTATLDVVAKARARPLVVVPPLSQKMAWLDPRARRYRAAIRRYGSTVDAARAFDSRGPDFFQPDEIHPDRRGALLLAEVVADRIVRDRMLGEAVDPAAVPDDFARARLVAPQADRGMRISRTESLRAVDVLSQVVVALPTRLRPRLELARALARIGRSEEAEAQARLLLERNPRLVQAYEVLAECAALRGDDRGAVRTLEQAVRIDRGFVGGHVILARTYAKLGERDRARGHLRAALRILPEDPLLLRLAARLR